MPVPSRSARSIGLILVSACVDDAAGTLEGDDGSDVGDSDTSTDTGAALDMPGGGCPLDMFDPNDSQATATPISLGTPIVATLCSPTDDVDGWTFTLTETSYVGLEAIFTKDSQDLALELWDGSGTRIDRSDGGAGIQAIHELLQPGDYTILVERVAGDLDYTLKSYALSTVGPAPSGAATRVFCPRFDLDGDYEDASAQAGVREDFGTEDAPDRWEPKAMLVRVLDNQGGVRRGWGPLDAGGCTSPVSTPSPNDTEFVLEYALWSHFVRPPNPDTFVILYDCEEFQPCTLPIRSIAWSTVTGSAVQESKFIASGEEGEEFREEALIYWAAAFSESRVSMGMDAHIYARSLGAAEFGGGGQFLACPTGVCPNGTLCEMRTPPGYPHCRPKTRGTINLGGHPTLDIAATDPIGNGAPEEKYTISHEFGHVQTIFVPGFPAMMLSVNYGWCTAAANFDSNHTADSSEWQSAALIEGFGNFYATATFNQLEEGAWYQTEDVENDTQRYQARCQTDLDMLMMMAGKCTQPGDATMCSDAGGSNEIDWAGTLWDFTKVGGEAELPGVLLLLVDAFQLTWDPGSTTPDAYTNLLQAASLRFPAQGAEFDAAAQANGTNR